MTLIWLFELKFSPTKLHTLGQSLLQNLHGSWVNQQIAITPIKFIFSTSEWFNIFFKCGVIYWLHYQSTDLKPDRNLVSLRISAQVLYAQNLFNSDTSLFRTVTDINDEVWLWHHGNKYDVPSHFSILAQFWAL